MSLKISIKNLVKVYYAVLNTLEVREAMAGFEMLQLRPEEVTLLEQDIDELKNAVLALQEILKHVYKVKTFEEILPKVMKQINGDPYNKLLFTVSGTEDELPMSTATYSTPSVWRGIGNDEIN